MASVSKNRVNAMSPKMLFGDAQARIDRDFTDFAQAYAAAIGPKSDFVTTDESSFFYKTSFVMVNDVTIANSYSSNVMIDSNLFGSGIFIRLMGEFNSIFENKNSRWDHSKAILLPSQGNNKYESAQEGVSGHLYINFNLERLNAVASLMSGGKTQPLSYVSPLQFDLRFGSLDFKQLFVNLVKQIDLFGGDVELLKLNAFDDQVYRLLAMLLYPDIFLKSYVTADEKAQTRHIGFGKLFEAYVMEHIEEPLSPTELQYVFHLSARALQYACQKHFGVTPREYIRNKRLDHIYELLRGGDATQINLAHLSYKYGFSSQSRFSSYFKERFGILPSILLKGAL